MVQKHESRRLLHTILFLAPISNEQRNQLAQVYRVCERLPECERGLKLEHKQIEMFGRPIPYRLVPSAREEYYDYICKDCGRNLNCFASHRKGYCPECGHTVEALLIPSQWNPDGRTAFHNN